jgi:alkanesulfonate monooxygenase SsuD/methylene tetrahydromethanopterin reductase-like flavin-dependent oxidoreductase (luciferase family)
MSTEEYAGRVDDVRRASEAAGRDDLRRSVGLYSIVAERAADVEALFEEGRASFPGGAINHEDLDSFRADTLSGTVEQVLERIDGFSRLGVEELIVSPWVLPFTIRRPEIVELFAERVIPAAR